MSEGLLLPGLRTDTLATRYKPRLFGKEPRWNDLRRIGNSAVARAAIAVPVLGYLILFHSDLINYLQLHSSFCKDCTVSWRLHLLYFASCSFALGSVLYAWRCPQIIKAYQTGRDFFESERLYFCHPQNLSYLFEMFAKEGAEPGDPFRIQSLALDSEGLSEPRAHMLSGLMGQYYFVQNRKHFWSRIAVVTAYAIGFLLLTIPTIVTFGQVLARFFGQ
jgi:hypothetical protein